MVIDYLRRMYAARETFKLDLSAFRYVMYAKRNLQNSPFILRLTNVCIPLGFRLRAIPPEVTEFEKLRELYLNDNDISVFPVAMSTLVDLRCACQKSPVKFVKEPYNPGKETH